MTICSSNFIIRKFCLYLLIWQTPYLLICRIAVKRSSLSPNIMLLILNYLIISVSLHFIFHLFCEALAMLKTKYRVLLLLVFVAYLYKFVVGIAVKNSLNVIALFNFQLLLCSYVWFLQLFKDQPIMSEHYKNDQIVETFIE